MAHSYSLCACGQMDIMAPLLRWSLRGQHIQLGSAAQHHGSELWEGQDSDRSETSCPHLVVPRQRDTQSHTDAGLCLTRTAYPWWARRHGFNTHTACSCFPVLFQRPQAWLLLLLVQFLVRAGPTELDQFNSLSTGRSSQLSPQSSQICKREAGIQMGVLCTDAEGTLQGSSCS
jgi:hypothetical protein